MKTKSIVYCFALAVGFLGSQTALAVDTFESSQQLTLGVTGSALLAVWAPAPVGLSLGGAEQAGAAITPVSTDATSRLKISSLASEVGGVTKTRYITASVTGATGGCVGHHTVLSVQLLAPNANFSGGTNGGILTVGLQPVSNHTVNTAAVTLVSGITTCWSGTVDGDGYIINYEYKGDGVLGVNSTSSAATTITFTIVDAA